MKLNFTLEEMCRSDIAKQNKIKNEPCLEYCDNLLLLITNVLQPLRDKLGKPIKVTSGYRCEKLNKMIPGSAQYSQHMLGQAADIQVNGCSTKDLFDYIKKSGIEYDQLINEYDRWVHVSYRPGYNRRQAFKL